MMKTINPTIVLTVALLTLAASHPAVAQEIVKQDNTTALNLPGSWVGGTTVPGAGDIAVWDSTLTVNRANALGGNLSFAGIKVTNPGGTLYTISPTTGATLTLGASGIDLSAATADFRINSVMALSAAQTWSIGSGRTLTYSGQFGSPTISGAHNLEITGPGRFELQRAGSATTWSLGTGTLTLGGGVRLVNTGSGNNSTITNATTLTGNITIEANPTASQDAILAVIFSGGLNIGSANRTITLSRPLNTGVLGSLNNAVLQVTTANGITGSGTLTLLNESANPALATTFGISDSGSLGVAGLEIGNNVFVSVSGGAANIGSGTAVTLQAGGRSEPWVGVASRPL